MNLPNLEKSYPGTLKHKATSTVGRGKVTNLNTNLNFSAWSDEYASLHLGDSLQHYDNWEQPTAIVSDGAYGILVLKETLQIVSTYPTGINRISRHGQKQQCHRQRSGFGTQKSVGLSCIRF
jgi:hypothetical protein